MKRSFKKCGINVNIDGSENALVHLEGISEYVMPEADEEFHVDTSTDDNDTSDEENFELIDAEEASSAIDSKLLATSLDFLLRFIFLCEQLLLTLPYL